MQGRDADGDGQEQGLQNGPKSKESLWLVYRVCPRSLPRLFVRYRNSHVKVLCPRRWCGRQIKRRKGCVSCWFCDTTIVSEKLVSAQDSYSATTNHNITIMKNADPLPSCRLFYPTRWVHCSRSYRCVWPRPSLPPPLLCCLPVPLLKPRLALIR